MNRRNFLQLLSAAALCSMAGIKPMTDDELRRQLDAEFQRNLDELAQRHNEWVAQYGEAYAARLQEVERQYGEWWARNA